MNIVLTGNDLTFPQLREVAYLVPSNYHWPTDTADRVDYGSVEDAVAMVQRVVQRLEDTSNPA